MIWGVIILFLIITITLLLGKGSFLIAGYNTSKKEDKMKYNEKKLCRVVGSGMGVSTIFLILLACFGDKPPNWVVIASPLGIILATITVLILSNTICKVNTPVVEEETNSEKKRHAFIIKIYLIVAVVISLVVGIILFTGQIKITVDENKIAIVGSYWADYNVELNTIKSVSYVETLDTGRRTYGWGSFKLLEGKFRNNEFGAYILYAYLKCDRYVVLDTANGIVVINAETPQKTENLYQELKDAVVQQQ